MNKDELVDAITGRIKPPSADPVEEREFFGGETAEELQRRRAKEDRDFEKFNQ